MFPIVNKADAELIGPTSDSTAGLDYPGTNTAATGSAQSIDTGCTEGGFMLGIQPRGATCYLRFSSTGTTGTTTGNAGNGLALDGSGTAIYFFWVTPRRRFLDLIQASGNIFWWKSSPNYYQDQGRAR